MSEQTKVPTNDQAKVPVLNKLAYGLGTGGGCVFNQIAAAFLLNYYTDTAMIGAAAIGTMFLVCRVFDGISDFVMGGIVDKTHTKIGKARPWLLLSGPLTLLGIVLLMNVPGGLSDGGKLVYAYATYIFMNCIVYTIYGIANTALLPLLTRNPKESVMLSTVSAIGNNGIGLVAGVAITPLVLNLGWTVSSFILGGAACVLILFSALINKEVGTGPDAAGGPAPASVPMSEQLPAVLKNRYFWLLMLIGVFSLLMNANAIGAQMYYCGNVLGDPGYMTVLMTAGQFPGLVIMFLMPVIANKWSKQVFLGLGTVIRSFGAGPLLSAVFALVPDVVEYGYWKFGVRTEGMISSAQSIGSKVGIGFGSAMTAWILAAVGYDQTPGAVQSEAVIKAIQFDYTWLGAILGVVILVIVLLTNVEKYAPQYRKGMEGPAPKR